MKIEEMGSTMTTDGKMMNVHLYTSALRDNARLRKSVEVLEKRVADLEAERNRLKASRGAVLKALDIKGRLKQIFEIARKRT